MMRVVSRALGVKKWMNTLLRVSLAALLTSGCAWLVKPPQDQEQARVLVNRFGGQNQDIDQFKGIGTLRLQAKGQVLSGRVAFAAALPDQLRVEWLNMIGQPLTSLAGDGRTITILSMNDLKLQRLKQTDTALSSVIRIPVGIADLTALLAGRLPLPEHTAAWMTLDNDSVQHVDLKNRWAGTVASFEVDKPQRQLQAMTVFAVDGTIKYQIQWARWQVLDNRHLPRQILLEAQTGERVTLSLDRYWFDVDLPPDTFILTVPEK